jgi:hypothetical protein
MIGASNSGERGNKQTHSPSNNEDLNIISPILKNIQPENRLKGTNH